MTARGSPRNIRGNDVPVAPSANAEPAADVEAALAGCLGAAIPEGGAVVVCASTTYSGGDKPAQTWTNWSGHFSGTVNRSVEPDSLSSLVNIVQQATSTGHQLHVIGSGWAFENIAWSPDWMVSLARLNKQVTYVTNSALIAPWAVSGGGNNLVFHIEAGATIADLNDALASNGLAMPTLGGNVGQAVAGAISTGTHGGDPTQPPLADAVVAMHVVTEGGRELWVERASEPITDDLKLANALPCKDTEIIRDDGISTPCSSRAAGSASSIPTSCECDPSSASRSGP